MAAFELTPVWTKVSPQIATDVAAFWTSHRVLTVTEAWRRTAELVVVGREEAGVPCAVSTAVAQWCPLLDLPMFYVRMFVAPRQRNLHLAHELLSQTVRTLATAARTHPDGGPVGVWLEIENPKVNRVIRDLVWRVREFDFIYIGRSEQGHVSRACYFPDTRLPAPDPANR